MQMLVRKEEAQEIVKDCKLVKVSKSCKCMRKELVDITEENDGYVVVGNGVAQYYEFQESEISNEVYNGAYSIRDALITANNVHYVDYHGVRIIPTWCIELDTISGNVTYKRVEEYKPISIGRNILRVCWVGSSTNSFLRNKIRRKMKEAVRSGKAILK